MKNHDLVAFYQSRDTAERVRDELLAADFDRDDVKVYTSTGKETGGGFWDSLKETFGFIDDEDKALYAEAARRGSSAVAVSLDDADGPPAQRAVQIIQRYKPLDLDQQALQWRREGWAGSQQPTTATTGQTQQRQTTAKNLTQGQEAIPVVQEELRVGKRRVEGGGVRIHTRVTEKPVEEQVRLREERVKVERRPVDRPLTAADRPFQERSVEATEMREEAVIEKTPRVVEEVRVSKEANERTQTVRDTVRRTDVQVEQTGGQPGHTTEFVDTFATQLAGDARFRNRDWNTVEPEARKSFEQRYPGNKWDQFKDAVHRTWDRARSKA
jgi:uncharacterized protein (TIGR02271 family)